MSQLDQQEVAQFFQEAEKHRKILEQIEVVIPVRPQGGMNCHLARIVSVWYGVGVNWAHINDHMGGFIELTRANILLNFAKNSDREYLLMIDNDMEPPVRLPYLLARHGKDCVGSCAVSLNDMWGAQLCFSVRDLAGKWRFPAMQSSPIIPAKGLIEVGHAGTGAMLISRKLAESFTFEQGDVPFYVPEEQRINGGETGRLLVGEDISFCNQARKKGFNVYVDLEAHVGHRKSIVLDWPKENRSEEMDPDSWVLPEKGHLFSDGAID